MDISTIFKSKTRKELFRLYFTNPDSEYYLRELERTLDIPVSMIRGELLRLDKEGVFVSSKKGNLTYFSLNKSYPLFEELKSIVSKTIGVKALLKQTFSKVKGIKVAFIYGSFARNEEKADSDIDVFIIGDIDQNKLVGNLRYLEGILRREVNYTLYTKKEFQQKRKDEDSFILELLRQKKIFLVGDSNDLP